MPLTESVRLDVAQAEAAIAALRRDVESLGGTRVLDVTVQADDRPLRTIDERLDSIEANVADVNRDVSDIAVSAGQATGEFQQMASALGVSETEARQLADQILTADRAARQIDDSARAVARELGLADDDARRFASEMSRASRETRETDQAMDRVAAGAARLRVAIVGAVAAFGIRGLIRGAGDAIESFNLLNESVNAVNVTFEDGADTVFEFGENVARTAGLARGEFQQAVVPIGALLRNFGFDAQQAGTAAVTLTQRAADLASVFNTDVSEAIEAIQAGLRGEGNPLERFGAGISAVRVEAKALELGLAATKAEITDLDKVTARYNLILSDTARVQGDFAKTAEDPANAARIIAAEFENARATIGGALIPAWQELLDLAPDLVEEIEAIGPALGGVASAAVQSAPGVVAFLQEILDLVDQLTGGLQLAPVRDELIGTLDAAERGLADLARAVFLTDLDDQFNALFVSSAEVEAQFARVQEAFNDMKGDIDRGVDPSSALAAALGTIGREATLTGAAIEIFGRRAGLSGLELAAFLAQFRDSSQAIGLTDAELALLTQTIIRLKDEAAFPPGSFEGIVPDLSGFTSEADDGIVTLQELRDAAREAGVTIQEALGSDLFPAGTVFDVFAEAEVEVANFRDRVNEIGRTIDPLKGAAEAVELSRAEFTENVRAAFEQNVEFEANLARLGQRGFTALEESLRQLGPGANALVVEFLNNAADAQANEERLRGAASGFAQGMEAALRDEFTASLFTGLPDELARALALAFETDPGTGFDSLAEKQARQINQGLRSPAALGQLAEGGRDSAEEVTSAFAAEVARLAPAVGFDAAIDIARALTTGEGAAQAEQAGIDWARLFSAAVAANVTFDFQPPGSITPSGTSTTGGGPNLGPNEGLPTPAFSLTITNPTITSLDTALAQGEQAAQTITSLLL